MHNTLSNSGFILPFSLSGEQIDLIEQRLEEFSQLHKADNKAWFSELCFCLLTANSQAKKAILLQELIGQNGFLTLSEQELAAIIRSVGHRFHNTKARYIVAARAYKNIKDILKSMPAQQAREFLVQNIKGLGYKESSHFLRNVGYHDIAIIDRHIVRFLYKYNFIEHQPKVINKKTYLELECILAKFNIAQDKLDLMIWCHMTGVILK